MMDWSREFATKREADIAYGADTVENLDEEAAFMEEEAWILCQDRMEARQGPQPRRRVIDDHILY